MMWYVYRKDINSDWSDAINMGNPINSEQNEFYPSLADIGNLYFTANNNDSKCKDDIYFSELKNGEYQPHYSLSTAIITEGDEYNAYVSNDGSYLVFGVYKRADVLGSGGLYISYKQDDKQWSLAQNMGAKTNSK